MDGASIIAASCNVVVTNTIPHLIRVLGGHDGDEIIINAAKALFNLVKDDDANKAVAKVAIVPLTRLLEPGNSNYVQTIAVQILCALISGGNEVNRVAALRAKAMLSHLLLQEDSPLQLRFSAMRAIRFMELGEPAPPMTPQDESQPLKSEVDRKSVPCSTSLSSWSNIM